MGARNPWFLFPRKRLPFQNYGFGARSRILATTLKYFITAISVNPLSPSEFKVSACAFGISGPDNIITAQLDLMRNL